MTKQQDNLFLSVTLLRIQTLIGCATATSRVRQARSDTSSILYLEFELMYQ